MVHDSTHFGQSRTGLAGHAGRGWWAVLKGGLLYFGIVFSVGFVLGVARTLWVSNRLGASAAEILEAPFMIFVSFAASRWVVRRQKPMPGLRVRAGIGLLALGLMVGMEIGVVLRIRGLSLETYLATRDPLASGVYLFSLVIFGLMPVLATRR